jgi:hypothetical protein
VFSDDPDAVVLFLREHGVPAEIQTRRLRVSREEQADYPVLLFAADGLPFDLTVMPRDALRQAPLDRMEEKPMRRASLTAVEELLSGLDADGDLERMLAAVRR